MITEEEKGRMIEELKQQLAESEKKHLLGEKEWQDYCAFKCIEPEIRGCLDREREYKKQLAEKEEKLEEKTVALKELRQKCFEEQKEHFQETAVLYRGIAEHNQDKISFCIEQLEKAKSFCISAEDNGWCVTHKDWLDIVEYIDNQIKQLKEMK